MENLLDIVNSLDNNELHRAVQENRLEGVQFLIANGADIANTIDDGQTPLHLSCHLNFPHITKELLKNKSRDELRNVVNARTLRIGETALHLAAIDNSLENARLLLAHGAQYRATNKLSQEPQFSDRSVVDLISCIDKVFISTLTGQTKDVLDTLNSCARENLSAVVYARNSNDQTALQKAMGTFDLGTVGKIVDLRMNKLKGSPWQAGAKIDGLMLHSKAARLRCSRLDNHCFETAYLTVRDLFREVKDFLAAYKEIGDISLAEQPLLIVIEESLEFFGSSDTTKFITNENFSRLLHHQEFSKMLKLCLIAPMTLFMRRVYTAELLEAAQKNDSSLIAKYLTGHPDLNGVDANGRTALRYAFKHGNYEIARTLLRLGADPSSEKCWRNEPFLHFALRLMREKKLYIDVIIVELMFDRVSDDKLFDFVNARVADDGTTALHWAASRSDFLLVQLLLRKGASYCAKSACRQEPKFCTDDVDVRRLLEFADRSFEQARNGHTKELMHALKKLGVPTLLAIVGTRDDEGQTLDRVAESSGHVETAEQIRQLLQAIERADHCKRHAGEFSRY